MNALTTYPAERQSPPVAPVLRQRWEDVAFVHWPVPSTVVARRLPAGLEPDLHDGRAWVGLVAFRMVGIGPVGGPGIPWLGSFPETNVRTYVRDREGRPGVWFDSLDASRLLPVLVARRLWDLPYAWSSMAVRGGAAGAYRARRRWPDAGLASTLEVVPREPVPVVGLTAFLVNRWQLFTATRDGGVAVADVDHEPWSLRRADLVALEDDLATAVGYPAPPAEPLVHHATAVNVRAGRPRRVRWL